jgi:small subunit ribosomal protein S2
MRKPPDALFIIDSHLENLAVKEAKAMNVPTVAIVDTNADPYLVNHPIPANDDAVGSIKLIVIAVMDAWVEGIKAQKPSSAEATDGKPSKESTKAKVQEVEKVQDKKEKVEKKAVKKVVKKETKTKK